MTQDAPDDSAAPPTPDLVEQRMKIEIRDIGIPPRPAILGLIEQETAKDEPDFIYLAKLINQDVALSAGMIKVANSPYFSFGKKVPTVQEALLVLGLKLVSNTIAGLALQQIFRHVPNMEQFWDASAVNADTAARLTKHLGNGLGFRPEDAYTYALFRDCGIPMLLIPFPEYREVLEKACQDSENNFTELEQNAIGLDHAHLGAHLAEDWQLPPDTVLAIRHHHNLAALQGPEPISERACRLIAVGHLAEYLTELKTGYRQTCEWAKLGEACLASLNLSPEVLPELAEICVGTQ